MDMKRFFVVASCFLALQLSRADDALTPADIIKAVEKMTPEQAYDFSQKFEARMWEPVPESIFTRLGIFVSVASASFDKVDVSGVDMASRDLNIEDMLGLEYGIMWCVANRTRIGIKADIWMSQDSSLTEAGYSRGELDAAAVSLALNYRVIEKPKWALWTELDLGGGAAELRTANTPAGAATTDRYFEGDFVLANAQVGLAWRLNRLVSLYGAGSWRFASSGKLDEGGQDSSVEFDPSGFGMQVGLGVNY